MKRGKALNFRRRRFIVSAAAAGGGLALGFNPRFAARTAIAHDPPAEVTVWVVIKEDDTCTIRVARSEVGQGTHTGLAQLVAEELECDWRKVTVDRVTAAQNLARKRAWGDMSSRGSRGIRASHDYVRRGGAAARMMLLRAAANRWKVPVGELTVSQGIITHAASRRTTSYGKVAQAARRLAPPGANAIKLKNPRDWNIAGKSMKRLDTPQKLNGIHTYSIDMKLPGLLNAAVKQCPVFGGRLVSFDESRVAKMPGVTRVVRVDSATVAVVADTWWHAKKALDALPIVWNEGPNANVTSSSIAQHLRAGLTSNDAFADTSIGEAVKAVAAAGKKLEAVYSTPFLAHATMEPPVCTALVDKDRAEIWVGTQDPETSLATLAETSGIPLVRCNVYNQDAGGGFGRRAMASDFIRQSVSIAKQLPGVPVKLIWSREEDQAHDFYRPVSMCRLQAGIDEGGNLVGLHMRVCGQSINAALDAAAIKDGQDVRQLQGLWKEAGEAQFGYTVPNLKIEYAMRNTHVPPGPWRGVNTNQNAVYLECFMDEAARAAGKDPLEFRRALMKNHLKHLGVLNAVAEKAGWGRPLAAGVHRGIAQFMAYGSYCAAVAEVSVSRQGVPKVHRMVVAINCGHVVNPGQVAAQIEGSVAYGLSATLYGECTLDKGRIMELNFDNYPVVKLAEFPNVETVLVPTYDFWGGVGESTICVVAPAVMNAIYAATGKPVRSLPLKNLKLV